jgi:hypothetical protein
LGRGWSLGTSATLQNRCQSRFAEVKQTI